MWWEYVYIYSHTGLLEGPIRKLHCIQQIDPPPGADVAQATGWHQNNVFVNRLPDRARVNGLFDIAKAWSWQLVSLWLLFVPIMLCLRRGASLPGWVAICFWFWRHQRHWVRRRRWLCQRQATGTGGTHLEKPRATNCCALLGYEAHSLNAMRRSASLLSGD